MKQSANPARPQPTSFEGRGFRRSAKMTRFPIALLGCAVSLLLGCQQKMADQPSYKPLDASEFFADGRSARSPVSGTVARGHLQIDRALYTGRISGRRREDVKSLSENGSRIGSKPPLSDGAKTPEVVPQPDAAAEPEAMPLVEREAEENNDFIDYFPLSVTKELIRHGHDRYMIYCVVCHDPLGTGHGKVVERGYTRPPSYHVDRLRQAPVGRLFAVMTEGYGSMPSYAEQIPVRDRWAIAAYVRALQLSQHFPAEEVPTRLEREWTRRDNLAQGTSP